jgi:hypothetical protein
MFWAPRAGWRPRLAGGFTLFADCFTLRGRGRGRCDLTLTLVALAAPPPPAELSRGVPSSRIHMVNTAPSGRSWLIRDPMNLVSTTVMISAHATVKKPKLKPTARSPVRTSRNTRIPTPHETYLARQGKVAFGGPSQTASTR